MNLRKPGWLLQFSIFMAVSSAATLPAQASLTDCQDLYVGRIWVERGFGLKAVVFLVHATDAGGSYWSYFDNWTADERKSALATLEAAKLAGHRVHVTTDNVDGCGISTGGTYVKALFMATSP
ncbi:MAG: hypothetical protein ABI769_01865 [Pseudomonadota bacterium]